MTTRCSRRASRSRTCSGGNPRGQYDAVVIGFFLGHVPATRVDALLRVVAAALRPDGHLFFVDTLPAPTGGRTGLAPLSLEDEIQHTTSTTAASSTCQEAPALG
jgi:2-polyprenyl-3-methyl-5-hydroxy-6-metoxy-1,4-benzoquinol methylase